MSASPAWIKHTRWVLILLNRNQRRCDNFSFTNLKMTFWLLSHKNFNKKLNCETRLARSWTKHCNITFASLPYKLLPFCFPDAQLKNKSRSWEKATRSQNEEGTSEVIDGHCQRTGTPPCPDVLNRARIHPRPWLFLCVWDEPHLL